MAQKQGPPAHTQPAAGFRNGSSCLGQVKRLPRGLDRHDQTSLSLFQFPEVLGENAFCKLFWSWEVLRNPLAHSQSVK